MNNKIGLPASIALLALLVSSGVQATTERPQLKNYASYTDFLRAVVDYTKGTGNLSASERECRDDEVGPDSEPLDKQNPCRVKEARGDAIRIGTVDQGPGVTVLQDDAGSTGATGSSDSEGTPGSAGSSGPTGGLDNLDDLGSLDNLDNLGSLDNPDGSSTSTGQDDALGAGPAPLSAASGNPSGDTLEQAIALARDGLNPSYSDPGSTRTTFRSFPMQPIEADDLAAVTFIDALDGLLVTTRDSKVRLSLDPNTMTNPLMLTDDRLAADDLSLNLDSIAFQQLLLDNVAPFFGGNFVWTTGGNYYSIVNANPSFIDDNGVALEFSTQARVRAAIVDSDGWISSANPNIPTAGALVMDPLNVTTGTISAKLWAIQDDSGNSSVRTLLEAGNDIVVDLSNSMLGVAGATRNETSWDIGPASNFMAFGADSILSIRLDGPMETILANPDEETNTPLIRINGGISRLSLSNIALLDGSSGHGIHFGRYTISNLAMVNTSVFFENDAIRVDLGKGADNLHVAIERIVLGGTMADRANGTLPAAIGDAEMYIKTPDNMQIILRAH